MAVTFSVDGDGVGTVTLNRPDKLNAMGYEVFEGLHAAAAEAADAAADGTCRAVLVIGAGRAFSAGLDVSLFAEQAAGKAPDDAHIAHLQQAFTGFEDLRVPTVAAIHGVAIGAGCQLALACQLRIGAPDITLGLLEARWALIPDLGATWRLPRIVGVSRATDLAVTGRTIDATTASSWGLLDAVQPEDQDFEAWAHDYVAKLAAGPTVAIGAVPALMRNSFTHERDVVLAAERHTQALCLASADFAEAARAGMEGRKPRFEGR